MRTFNYSTVHFPLHKFVAGYIKDLNCPHDTWEDRVADIVNDDDFKRLYSNFIKYCQPFFENAGLVPTDQPIFRIQDGGNFSIIIGDTSKVSRKSKAVYVALTPLFGSNSFLVESKPGLEDFNIVDLKVGQFAIYDCDKKTIEVRNQTGLVSIIMIIGFNPCEK